MTGNHAVHRRTASGALEMEDLLAVPGDGGRSA